MSSRKKPKNDSVALSIEGLSDDIKAHIENLEFQIDKLAEIGYSLSTEHNLPKLLNTILVEAMRITNADGGTLYLRTEDDRLRFEIMKTRSMGTDMGGISKIPIPDTIYPVRLYMQDTGEPNHHNICASVALTGKTANIEDAYETEEFDFSGTKGFDKKSGYRSKSFLTIAMKNHEGDIIGVLQLLNALDPETDEIVSFTVEKQHLIESLASQAAVAITNVRLIQELEELLEAFIQLIADAIDEKSPYTGGHNKRVPTIAMMIAEKINDTEEGPLGPVKFTAEDMHELRIAAWLHDVGKITTPEYVVDKSTKLETIYDRVTEVEWRFQVAKQEVEIEYLKQKAELNEDQDSKELKNLEKWHRKQLRDLNADLKFIQTTNIGGEFMTPEHQERVQSIAQRRITLHGKKVQMLNENMVHNLNIKRGTLTEAERNKINDHVKVTLDMLEKLPFPKKLRHVPEFAGGHHEKMDGTGYPRGLKKEEMSIQARIMAIADVFEALTASDRPYKKGKKLSEALKIMGFMKRENHIDPDIFDVFLKRDVFKEYANDNLKPENVDTVDIDPLLEISPDPY